MNRFDQYATVWLPIFEWLQDHPNKAYKIQAESLSRRVCEEAVKAKSAYLDAYLHVENSTTSVLKATTIKEQFGLVYLVYVNPKDLLVEVNELVLASMEQQQ